LDVASVAVNSTEISAVQLAMAMFVFSRVMACTALVEVSMCAV
jgi:hypothetical protein